MLRLTIQTPDSNGSATQRAFIQILTVYFINNLTDDGREWSQGDIFNSIPRCSQSSSFTVQTDAEEIVGNKNQSSEWN